MVRPRGQTIRFPDTELEKLEAIHRETDLSINKIVIKIVKEYFENNKNKIFTGIAELSPEYQTALLEKSDDEIIQFILDELKDLRAAIDNLEKDKN